MNRAGTHTRRILRHAAGTPSLSIEDAIEKTLYEIENSQIIELSLIKAKCNFVFETYGSRCFCALLHLTSGSYRGE